MKYSTVIFDLDGTLVNTLDDIRDSLNYTLNAFGYEERSLLEVREAIGNASGWLIEKSIPGGKENPDYEKILEFYKEYYKEHSMVKSVPYEGVHDMLRKLSNSEYKLAVNSNKPDITAKRIVNRFFGDVVSLTIGEKKGIERKPAPDAARAAMRELMSYPEECVYVGDSDIDIITARNAGIASISVTWGFRSREELIRAGAKRIANSPRELLKLL